MKGTDKFLAGIVLGIVLLVIIAVGLVMTRPAASYKDDNSAENVAYNYLFALQERNYVRAYSYLSPSLSGYPSTVDRFSADLRIYDLNLDDSLSLEIASSRPVVSSLESAEVSVRSTRFGGGGLFGPGQNSWLFRVELQKEKGNWKIIGSDQYFANCWTRPAGCQ